MVTSTMNQINKREIEVVVYKVKCLACNSIYIEETRRKLKKE